MTRVLVAFDKFKDALTAHAAGEIVSTVLRETHPEWPIELAPLADGGEGFASILTHAVGGGWQECSVTGPLGERVGAGFGLVPAARIPAIARAQLQLPDDVAPGAQVAVIEMASASGLALIPITARNPWQTTTRGTGELMRAAVEAGAVAIILGVGGSATHDLGLGALSALGFNFHDTLGSTVERPVPARWADIERITGALPDGFPPVYIACDVTNPLLGLRGAAAVYGPQKGLEPADHPHLEHASARVARLLCAYCERPTDLVTVPGAGAAGGIAFGLMAAAGAKLLPGFALVSAWLDLEKKLAAADLVITGEGRFDESSLEGKGPGAVAARALALGKTVHVFAGQVTASTMRERLHLHAITPVGVPLAQALREAPVNLAASVRAVLST